MSHLTLSSSNASKWQLWRRASALGALALGAGLLLLGCSGGERPVGLGEPVSGGTRLPNEGEPCEAGMTQVCGVTLEQDSGSMSCYRGVQYCVDGVWGACSDGRVTKEALPKIGLEYGKYRNLSLSAPADCNDDSLPGGASSGRFYNPCDPKCMYFEEDPADISVSGSGGSSGSLPNWPGTPDTQSCAHDFCTEGAGLTDGCHSCISTVCATDPSCCDTSNPSAWDDACVDLVYTACLSRPAPYSLCDFAIYSANTLTFAGGEVVGAPIGAGNSGGAGTAIQFSTSGNGTVTGMVADGNVVLNLSQVTGNLTTTGSITKQNGSTTGSETVVSEIEVPSIPTKSISCLTPSGSLSVSSGTTVLSPGDARAITLSGSAATVVLDGPGKYGSITFNADAKLVFKSAGTYSFSTIYVSSNSPQFLFPDGQKVYVDVCTDLTLQNNPVVRKYSYSDTCAGVATWVSGSSYATGAEVQRSGTRYQCIVGGWCSSTADSFYAPGTGSAWTQAWSGVGSCTSSYANTGVSPNPLDVVWYTDDTFVTIGPAAITSGVLVAPNGTVSISGANSGFYAQGLIWAKDFTSSGNPVKIDATGFTGDVCEAANIIPGAVEPPSSCPIENITKGAPAAIVEPCVSGADCQINHRCVEPETEDLGSSCPHSKCMSGSAMGALCQDECVSRICDVKPSCCSGEWTQDCVDMVASECDAVCGTPACQADACEVGAPIAASCDSCVASVCAVMPSCCTTAWTSACVDKVYSLCSSDLPISPPSGGSICDYAVYGGNQVQVQGSSSSRTTVLGSSWIGAPNNGSMAIQYVDANDSNVTASGSLNLQYSDWDGHFVSGSGSINAAFSTGSYSQISTSPPSVTLPSRSFSCSGADGMPSSGNIGPGNYGAVSVTDLATLTLAPGTYTFASLTIGQDDADSSGGTLALPSTGDVTLNVCGKILFTPYSNMTGLSADIAMNLDVYVQGGFEALGNNNIYGFIHSAGSGGTGVSAGDIWIGANSYVTGLLIAEDRADVRNGGTTIDPQGLASACRDKGYDGAGGNAASSPARLCAYSAYGTQGLSLQSGASLSGGDAGSKTSATLAGSSVIKGSLYAGSSVSVGSGTALVHGQVQAGGSKTGSGTLSSFGTQQFNSGSVPNPDFPAVPFSSCSGSSAPSSSPAPGDYGWVDLWWGSDIELSAGTYTFQQFNLHQSNTLTLPATGTVNIYSCGSVRFGESTGGVGLVVRVRTGASTFRSMNASDAARFRVYSLLDGNGSDTSAAIHFDDSLTTPIAGMFIAPNGWISNQSPYSVYGQAWGEQFYGYAGTKLDATGISGEACELLGIDERPACPVDITAVPPSETATCTANSLGYKDASCAGYDLAADIPCGTQVPICNHGSGDFSGSVTIGYWAEAQGQMSSEMPVISPDGTCTDTLSIAAGNCANLNCAVPAGTHSIMVDPSGTLSECDTRRLDNWTVHDGRSCGAGSGSTSVEYEYEAVCPEKTVGQWGFLIWETAAPGSSQITFSAKTATTQAGLASASYVQVGVADDSGLDTQSCTLFGPTGCPVDLQAALSLGLNQGSHLSLKIELDSNGYTPVLKDWAVTYTCVYDQ